MSVVRTIACLAAMEFRWSVGRNAKFVVWALVFMTAALIWVDQVRPLSTRG